MSHWDLGIVTWTYLTYPDYILTCLCLCPLFSHSPLLYYIGSHSNVYFGFLENIYWYMCIFLFRSNGIMSSCSVFILSSLSTVFKVHPCCCIHTRNVLLLAALWYSRMRHCHHFPLRLPVKDVQFCLRRPCPMPGYKVILHHYFLIL